MSEVYPREFDVSDISNIKFKCIKGCGSCCFTGLVSISTNEIRRILIFLKRMDKKSLRKFIKASVKNSEEMKSFYGKGFSGDKNLLQGFYVPGSFYTKNKVKYVKTFFLFSEKSTGKCIFLDPIRLTCLIFPVRPIACRLCPITAVLQLEKTKLIIGYPKCPGIDKGNYFNMVEIKAIVLKGYNWIEQDLDFFKKFISTNTFQKSDEFLFINKKHIKTDPENIIDPYAINGLIPPSLYLNEQNENKPLNLRS